ncbi:(R)-mandelonitrile lyase [Mycobacterium szulgai]|uniref:(R)-mandelonitrile lyase n=1 Tax=Mycobacterium szulgai TaxID=1787 RepID=UPI0021F2EC8D|nr:cupin domain-containing protein [Mycobacterium szulgai]MCV7075989.1 cupin domain-containing protein [Mycobacterium szulgai]
MRRILMLATFLAAIARFGLFKTSSGDEADMRISRDDERPAMPGPQEFFTGDVTMKPLFGPADSSDAHGGQLTFAAGARSAWHTHPAGQRLIVTSGTGWIQQWGSDRQQINPGDVIWTPAGVKHWHGATSSAPMTHIAIQDEVAGRYVDWLEKVSDDEYLSATETSPTGNPGIADD